MKPAKWSGRRPGFEAATKAGAIQTREEAPQILNVALLFVVEERFPFVHDVHSERLKRRVTHNCELAMHHVSEIQGDKARGHLHRIISAGVFPECGTLRRS